MFSFFMVSVVGLNFCVHMYQRSAGGNPSGKIHMKPASSILFSEGRSVSLNDGSPFITSACEQSRLADRAQCVLQALARAIDAGLHRLRADAEKLRALLLRTAFDGK